MIFKFLFFISIGHFGPALVVGQENGRHEHTLTSNAVSTTQKPKVWDLIFPTKVELCPRALPRLPWVK